MNRFLPLFGVTVICLGLALAIELPLARWAVDSFVASAMGALLAALAGPWTVLTIILALALVDAGQRWVERSCALPVRPAGPWFGLWIGSLLALPICVAIKLVAGRARPLVNGLDPEQFMPFASAPGWDSLPSAHAAMVGAVAAGLWIHSPRFRPCIALLGLAGAIGPVLLAEHWLTDVVAGTIVGAAVAVPIAQWQQRRKSRLLETLEAAG